MGKTILFYGDSITDGNRYKTPESAGDLNHQIGHSYAYMVTGRIGADHPERGYQFKNRGVSGNRVTDLYERLRDDVLPLKPDLLSVLIGVNDLYSGVEPAEYDAVYRKMLDEVRTACPSCQFLLCEPFILPNPNNQEEDFAARASALRPMQNAVREIAAEYGAYFVPLQTVFTEMARRFGPLCWIWDGVHPTEAGHQLIADAWTSVFRGSSLA